MRIAHDLEYFTFTDSDLVAAQQACWRSPTSGWRSSWTDSRLTTLAGRRRERLPSSRRRSPTASDHSPDSRHVKPLGRQFEICTDRPWENKSSLPRVDSGDRSQNRIKIVFNLRVLEIQGCDEPSRDMSLPCTMVSLLFLSQPKSRPNNPETGFKAILKLGIDEGGLLMGPLILNCTQFAFNFTSVLVWVSLSFTCVTPRVTYIGFLLTQDDIFPPELKQNYWHNPSKIAPKLKAYSIV